MSKRSSLVNIVRFCILVFIISILHLECRVGIPTSGKTSYSQRELSEFFLTELTNRNEVYFGELYDSLRTYDKYYKKIDAKELPKNVNLKHISSDTLKKYLKDAIYDVDDREDYFLVEDNEIQELFSGVVAIMHESNLITKKDSFIIKTKKFGKHKVEVDINGQDERVNLCKNERYYDQVCSPYCTGFAISDSVIVTAGHCVKDMDVKELVFVFDFMYETRNNLKTRYSKDEVYYGDKIIKYVNDGDLDYSIIKVDKDIPDNRQLRLNENYEYEEGDFIFVIGHPMGLPLKYATSAQITEVNKTYFSSDLDTYAGNSGSPVFDESSLEVIGILVRGAQDFVVFGKDSCGISNVCNFIYCEGEEDVIRLDKLVGI